jgi:hypothetical protein
MIPLSGEDDFLTDGAMGRRTGKNNCDIKDRVH